MNEFTAKADSVSLPRPQSITVTVYASDGSKVPFKFAGISGAVCGGCGDQRPPDFVVVSPATGVTRATVQVALNPNVAPFLPVRSFYKLTVTFVKAGESSGLRWTHCKFESDSPAATGSRCQCSQHR